MAKALWDEKYSVGIPSMDTHHKKLFELVNTLNDALDAGNAEDKIHGIINSLIAYTQGHFEKEEAIMKNNNYPEYSSHIKEHLALIKKVTEFVNAFHSGQTISEYNLITFLKSWLTDHILSTDKKYGVYLAGKGIA